MNDEVTSIMLNQIKEIDQLDDNQILAELAGETVKDFIYETEVWDPKAKKKVRKVKLSWIGTKQAALDRGNIALSEPMITDNDGYIRVVVRGTDLKRNVSIFGGCHQPKVQKVKDGDDSFHLEDDPYYFTKALSKAQRNVIQSILPAGFLARVIDKYLSASEKQPARQIPKENKPRVNKELSIVTPESIPTLASLEIVAYNRWHIQPKDMYRELNCSGRVDCTIEPWEAFLKLKAVYEK